MLFAALLLAAIPAGEATAALELTGAGGKSLRGPFKSWASAAHVPLPQGKVVVRLRGCPRRPDLVGCVITKRPRRIYLRSDARHKRSIFLHELGHVFDLTVIGRSDRRAFARLHGRAGRRWWRGTNPTAEWFAEAYSLCARFGSRRPARVSTTYSYRPSGWRHRASCRLIRSAAAEPGPRRRRPTPQAPPTITEPVQAPTQSPPPPPKRDCALLILCG